MLVKVLGLVDEANCRWEETVFLARGFGPDGPQPPARGKCFKQFMSGVRGVGHNLSCTPPDPGGIQVLERWQIAAKHPLCGADDTLQSALVLGVGSSVQNGNGGDEDGLDDGSVEVHHHRL